MRQALIAVGGSLLLVACQTLGPGGGIAPVADAVGRETGKEIAVIRTPDAAEAAEATVRRLLRRPLDADAAVQVALLNNRGLQAAYNELAVAEAAMVGASLPPNPVISLSRIAGSGNVEIERQIIADVLALATLPVRAELASNRFRQAQLQAIATTLRVAVAVRRAYYRTVASHELVSFLAQAQDAADAASQLAKRLGETGGLNKLDQAREHAFFADISTQAALARQRARVERERLVRLLGIWGSSLNFRLAGALPPLPHRPQALAAVEADAVRRRVDLQIARIEVETLARSYGLTQATRFISLLDVSAKSKTTRSSDAPTSTERGVEVEFQIPIFDFGEVRVREAEQNYLEAVNRLTQKAVNVRSEARDAYLVYRSTYDIAAHYQKEVLPLRKIISDESLLRYNAMQIDVFALLAEARQRLAASAAAIEARRDFWLASVNLFAAIVAGASAPDMTEPLTTAFAPAGESVGH